MKKEHQRIEVLAGAIAIGEATDDERRMYREHLSQCAECLRALGGEREIERVAQTVVQARESEIWQPQLGDVVRTRSNRRAQSIRHVVSVLAACLLVAFGVRVAVSSGVLRVGAPPAVHEPATSAFRISLETKRDAAPAPVPVRVAQPRLEVVHNVVQLARAPVAAAPAPAQPKPENSPSQIVAITVHPDMVPKQSAAARSDVPIWRRDVPLWHTVARTTTTSLSETAPGTFAQRAESIRMLRPDVVHDAYPIGGETAINPQPPVNAYEESAEGTTVFEVLVDEQGNPTKCLVTRSSGYGILDDSVCKAAMRAKYSPKTIDGRAVAGIYHDAFTFRVSMDDH
ncbi:MAG TPA: energy transducer TonB [Candidatus Baltobacteraceae bacterium]|nr:energy transducer TonB [Candidatus Baltobacteraceae bacterium]